MSEKFYITTPIYYVNGEPHIGHIYTTTLVECATIYQRLKGKDAYMLTGCDEHGLKVQTTAEANGKSPQEWCDVVATKFKDCFQKFNITGYNRFIRTSDADHIKTAQTVWKMLDSAGYIYKAKYEGYYNVSDECFVTDLNLKDGVDKQGKPCKVTSDTNVPCVWHSEENYMFKLTAFRDQLLAFYKQNPNVIIPNFRQQEIVSFIETGLQDLSISRSKQKIYWGIDVPGDENHTMYVWIDALANYLTGANWPDSKSMWPADFHVIGKDIIRFHCVYWPAFLMGCGLPQPKKWFVHGWWVAPDSQKIGKSLGNASPPQEQVDKFGVDALRYYILSEGTPESDSVIADDLVAAKLNADLCNALGNLLNRCVQNKMLPDQKVPQNLQIDLLLQSKIEDLLVQQVQNSSNELFQQVDQFMDELRTKDALLAIFKNIYDINNFLQQKAPWRLLVQNRDEYDLVMYTAIEALRIVGILLLPFLSTKAKEILKQLGIPEEEWKINKETMKFGFLKQGQEIGKEKDILFAKYEVKKEIVVNKPVQKVENPLINSFSKCDLRVTQIVECSVVENSDKLLLMKLDCGSLGQKTFVAGIQAYYKPEELINKKIVTIVNLKPRSMCEGKITSEAMLFAGSFEENGVKKMQLCFPDESAPLGTRVLVLNYETDFPEAEGDPKKNFDKVLKELKARDGKMVLGDFVLLADGKSINCAAPNETQLG